MDILRLSLILLFFTKTLYSLKFDVTSANQTLHLAYASFCNETALKEWDCHFCGGNTPRVVLLKYLKNKLAGTQGYVGWDVAGGRLIVAYRGSMNVANYIEDGEFWLTRFKPAGSRSVKVEHGFLQAYESLRGDTAEGLIDGARRCPNCTVLFTGHSLGAAMATLGAAEFSKILKVELFTYGCPRVGNTHFVTWTSSPKSDYVTPSLNGTSLRMARERDVVPSIPPEFLGYRHLPQEVWNKHGKHGPDTFVVCDESGEDPNCYNSKVNVSPAQHTQYMGFVGGSC